MGPDLPMILLPGMAADERLFGAQLDRFPNLRVPTWIHPHPREPLRAYAARLARTIDPGRPCVVGGASFGGIVALELATLVPAVACVLIGSIRSPTELPWRWRAARPLARLGPARLGQVAGAAARAGRRLLSPATARRFRRLARPEAAFVRWAMCAVLRWAPSPAARRVRVFHIHGERDRTLPVQLTRPDVVVPGGAHALSLFNPTAVNDFLAWVLRRVAPAI